MHSRIDAAIFHNSRSFNPEWLRIAAIVERDVKDISSIEKLVEMPRLLEVLAQQYGERCLSFGDKLWAIPFSMLD